MIRRYGKLIRFGVMFVDGALATLLSLLVYQWFAHPDVSPQQFISVFWARALLYGLLWVGLLYVHGAYRMRAHWTIYGEVAPIVRATFWLAALGFAALFLAATDVQGSGWALVLFPLQGLLAVLLRVLLRLVFMFARHQGHNVRNILVLGTGPEATAFTDLVHDHSVLGVQVSGYLGDEPPAADRATTFYGAYEELPRVLRDEVVDEVAICVPQAEWPRVEELAQLAHEEGKLIRIPLAVPELRSAERFVEELDGTAVLSYAHAPDELTAHAIKRLLDIGLAGLGLILGSPILLAIALALRLTQGPGVLFRQERVGMHGRLFMIVKYRTMTRDAEERYPELAHRSYTKGPAFKLQDDPRVTRSGRWLRRYSLDELPQLWNVLKGEMSIVGPRPAPAREVEEYDLWHRRRLSMKPGITGLWQITSRLDRDFDDRAELDMAYIDRWSLRLDLAILCRTIPAVLRGPGH